MTRYCRRATVVVVALILAAGCTSQTDIELAEGQEPYLRHCASCHGNTGEGKPPAFPPIAGSEWLDLGPDAIGLIVLGGLNGEIRVAGRTYRGYMPPMHHLSSDDISALVGYIGREWADWGDLPDAARIDRLREMIGDSRPIRGLEGLEALIERLPEGPAVQQQEPQRPARQRQERVEQ